MAAAKKILIVEDEEDLASLIKFNLEREGYHCSAFSDGKQAFAELKQHRPDLVLLDRMLPGMSGDQFALELRKRRDCAHIPIIMITAKATESDELVGFAMGVDDYISKPFSMKKLVARVGAVLRRGKDAKNAAPLLESGPLVLDRERFEVKVGGTLVKLTATEFRVLDALMASEGRVLSRSQLIDAALGEDAVVTDRTIDVHVTALRKKLASADGPSGRQVVAWIQTVRGVGYSFRSPDE